MTTLVLNKLSESVDGKPVCIIRTSTLGTTVHVAVSGTTTTIDRVTVQVANNDSISHVVTCEIGGGAQANRFPVNVPPNIGLMTILDRVPLRNGVVVTMFADLASVCNVIGSVLTGTP